MKLPSPFPPMITPSAHSIHAWAIRSVVTGSVKVNKGAWVPADMSFFAREKGRNERLSLTAKTINKERMMSLFSLAGRTKNL
ncbi:MAG: hypothetical protein WC291_03275 [Thermodesulfovibrionales bacterium]